MATPNRIYNFSAGPAVMPLDSAVCHVKRGGIVVVPRRRVRTLGHPRASDPNANVAPRGTVRRGR